MKDRVSVNPGRVLITPENGEAAYYAIMTRADNPTQEGDPLNKNTFLKDATAALFGLGENAVPDDVFGLLSGWRLLAEYKTAGSYTFTVPDDVDELGVLLLGAGGSGGTTSCFYNASNYSGKATGGASGQIMQFVLRRASGDFSTGQSIAAVVGAGGASVSSTNNKAGNAGGSSAFNGVTVSGGGGGKGDSGTGPNPDAASVTGGQNSDKDSTDFGSPAPFGGNVVPTRFQNWQGTRNIFDPKDLHIYCGAGGGVSLYAGSASPSNGTGQSVITRAKGSAGKGVGKGNGNATGGSATAPGDGGGAAGYADGGTTARTAKSGAGADGLILVYGRKTA